MVTYNEMVLKVTSICNLNCNYCYVFNRGDISHSLEPNFIDLEIVANTLKKIEQHCGKYDIKKFLMIFHGGEPLLIGKKFYQDVTKLINNLCSIEINLALQSNGTLIDDEWCQLAKELNIQIGVSLDGTRNASKHRVYKNGKDAFDNILRGISILKKYQDVRVLSVINVEEDPEEIYNIYKQNGIKGAGLLLPDINYKMSIDIPKVGKWLSRFFDIWYDDVYVEKPMITTFDLLIKKILGYDEIGTEEFGRNYNSVLVVKSNGHIEAVDSLKICGDGFTRSSRYNVIDNYFDDLMKDDLMYKYYNAHQDECLCEKCKNCLINDICGGGQLAHRYSDVNQFNNPSIYCNEMRNFIIHIQNRLVDDVPELKKCGVEKLVLNELN